MGFDNNCVLNIQSLSGEYFCPVCHLLVYPKEALQAPCTHLYCKPCLKYVASTTHACPYDGYRVTEADCKPLLESNKALADTIGKIQVRCLYYSTGCTWQGTLSECSSHCSACSFGESQVICNRCSVQIVHRQAQEHTQSCPGVQTQAQQTGAVQAGRIVSGQVTNQAANPAAQPQAAMPTLEQWQQYQLYYQQYLNYQYYYQYQQGAQHYPQPMQGYPPQPQIQVYAQAPAQPQIQVQLAQPQLQQQPQVPSQTVHPQPVGNAPAPVHLVGQAQPLVQAQNQAPSYQAFPCNHSNSYAQPQPVTQQMQVPQYQQTSQVQHPHTQAYPQSQATQNYPYPHPQPYPQPQPHPQGQGAAAHLMHNSGAQPQPQYPAQMQVKFPAQPSQMYPPPPPPPPPHYSNIPPQLPAVSFSQSQPPSGPTAVQPPAFSHSQQPGYLSQHRPNVQLAQQSTTTPHYGQQQSVPGHGPYMQPHPHMVAHSHVQGPPQITQQFQQNYVAGHGAQHDMTQNYIATPVVQAGAGLVRPPQQNQGNNQMSAGFEQQAGHLQQPLRTIVGEKPRDKVMLKSMHDQNNSNMENKNLVGGSDGVPDMGSFKHPPGPPLHENASAVVFPPGSSGPFPTPGNMDYYHGNMTLYQAGQPQKPPGEPFDRSSFVVQQPDSHAGVMENEKFSVQRPGNFDGGKPESFPRGSLDRSAYGPVESGAMNFGGSSSHDSMPAPRMSEKTTPFSEEHQKRFPHTDFEDVSRKVAKPCHSEAGSSSNYGTSFASSTALDHGPPVIAEDGRSRSFDKSLHGFDHNSGLERDSSVGFGTSRLLPYPSEVGERGCSPGFPHDNMEGGDFGDHTDLAGSPPGFGQSRTVGAFRDDGNSFLAERFGKSIHDNRLPAPPNHLQRGEIDVPGNLHFGGPRNQDRLPKNLQTDLVGLPQNMHMRERTHLRMGEYPLGENFPQHLPVDGEKPGHPLVGDSEFRGSFGFELFGCEGGFYPEDMERFNDPRKWKPEGIMCRICEVECGTVEDLDLHSQSREHQRNAREMALSIKQKSKKRKISKDEVPFERRDGGRQKNSCFQGRGNKR